MIAGQLLLSTIIDHFGLFNFPAIRMNFARLSGIILLLAGVFLVKK
jgi:uncharacterized membrane protein YdcZ (DUF606 family)